MCKGLNDTKTQKIGTVHRKYSLAIIIIFAIVRVTSMQKKMAISELDISNQKKSTTRISVLDLEVVQ